MDQDSLCPFLAFSDNPSFLPEHVALLPPHTHTQIKRPDMSKKKINNQELLKNAVSQCAHLKIALNEFKKR